MGDLGATYDDHLRLIAKRIVDFPLALIELFSLGVTAEALRAIIGSKFQLQWVRGPTRIRTGTAAVRFELGHVVELHGMKLHHQ